MKTSEPSQNIVNRDSDSFELFLTIPRNSGIGVGHLIAHGRCLNPGCPQEIPDLPFWVQPGGFHCEICGVEGDLVALAQLGFGLERHEAQAALQQWLELPHEQRLKTRLPELVAAK